MESERVTDISDEVRAAVAAGRKIDAIKLVRQEQGLGLKEAKELVDRMDVPGSSYVRVKSAHREESSTLRFLLIVLVVGAIGAAWLLL